MGGKIANFKKNGLTIEKTAPPPAMGSIGGQLGGYVGTAPGKHADIKLDEPYKIYNYDDLAKLDTTGKQEGTLYLSVKNHLDVSKTACYVVVVEKVEDAGAQQSKIIGDKDSQTGQLTGIAALASCKEAPTVFCAPSFSSIDVGNALGVVATASYGLAVIDGPNTNTVAAKAFSELFSDIHKRVIIADVAGEVWSTALDARVPLSPAAWACATCCSVEPWESPSNQDLLIADVARTIGYRITDSASEANDLNAYGVCVPCSTTKGGFTFIGTRTSNGEFINLLGLENAICRKLEATQQPEMAKLMSGEFFKQQITRLNNWLRSLKANGCLIDARVYLHPTRNNVDAYNSGEWVVCIDYAGYRPNEHTVIQLNESNEIVEKFVEQVTGEFA